jgi:hypothetical protein
VAQQALYNVFERSEYGKREVARMPDRELIYDDRTQEMVVRGGER